MVMQSEAMKGLGVGGCERVDGGFVLNAKCAQIIEDRTYREDDARPQRVQRDRFW